MLEQLKTYDNNILAFEIIDGFTETDMKLAHKWFEQKLETAEQVNILVKCDEFKMSETSVKAFFEDTLYALRHYKQMGNVAIVAHSKVLKALVPIDNMFFQRASKGRQERYFDVSQIDEAFAFIENS